MPTIRIVSPSGFIDPTYIDLASGRLCSWGFSVSEGEHARAQVGRFAGTDAERISDLQKALADPTIDILLCARGGYGLQRILPQIIPGTTDAVRWPLVVGFSDITALHQLMGLYHVPSLHGLMCKHIATLPMDSDVMVQYQKALTGLPLTYTLPSHPLNREGKINGYLCGGNLSVLYGLQDTAYSLKAVFQQHSDLPILFMEDIAERHYHIDRMINNLKMSGVFALLGGLIVGQFSDCEDDPSMGCSIYETIRQAVDEYDFPVYFNFPAGHVDGNFPLRFYTSALVNDSTLTIR